MELPPRVKEAVKFFWGVVGDADPDAHDNSSRSGNRLDGLANLITELLLECGIRREEIFTGRSRVEIPGWFRPEKRWDVLVVSGGQLVAAIELKAQIGEYGKNYNNRVEEMLGNATDALAAFREGAFKPSPQPWLGFLMLIADEHATRKPLKRYETHFGVFEEFRDASYIDRYRIALTKLLRDRLYDGAALLASDRERGREGEYTEPSEELGFTNFAESLAARAIAHVRTRKGG